MKVNGEGRQHADTIPDTLDLADLVLAQRAAPLWVFQQPHRLGFEMGNRPALLKRPAGARFIAPAAVPVCGKTGGCPISTGGQSASGRTLFNRA